MTTTQTLNDVADRLEYESLALNRVQAQALTDIVTRLRRLALRLGQPQVA